MNLNVNLAKWNPIPVAIMSCKFSKYDFKYKHDLKSKKDTDAMICILNIY